MQWSSNPSQPINCYPLDEQHSILLDPDRVFWSVVANDDPSAASEARQIHQAVADDLAARLHQFRFTTNITAIYLNPNDACHANCRYCYIPPDIRHHGPKMTRHQLQVVLEKAAAYLSQQQLGGRKPVIIFHGSEPLVVKDHVLWAIERYHNTFSFGLQTDGVLLQHDDIVFLRQYGVSVGISLDSPDPATHAYLRRAPGGQKAFAQTVSAIEAFDGYPGLNVVTTITRYNVQDLVPLIDFLHARRVPVALMNPVRGTQPYARPYQPDCDTLYDNFSRAVLRAIELTAASQHPILIGDFSNIVLGIIAPEGRRLMCDITPCGGARCFFAITGSGEMIPCGEFQGLPGFSGGNIFRDEIATAIDSQPFRQVRQRIVEHITECHDCAIRHICGAPCPAEAQGHVGNMLQPSPYCAFYKRMVKLAFSLIAEGKVCHLVRGQALASLEPDYCLAR